MDKNDLVKAMLAIYIMGHSKDPNVGLTDPINPVVTATNDVREQNGLPRLIQRDKLDTSATAKSKDINNQGYWSHINPQGQEPWVNITNAGYGYDKAGENLARNMTDPEEIVRAWINSPEHKALIMNPNYTETGAGTNGIYTTEHFATPIPTKKPTVWDYLTGKLK